MYVYILDILYVIDTIYYSKTCKNMVILCEYERMFLTFSCDIYGIFLWTEITQKMK